MGTFSTIIRTGTTVLPAHKLRLMELLRYSSMDLAEHLQEQSYANPLLEVHSRPACPRCGRGMDHKGCKSCRSLISSRRPSGHSYNTDSDRDYQDPADLMQQPRSALKSLLEQCGELHLSETESVIAGHLLGELNDQGILQGTVAEHAELLGLPGALVESVRQQIMTLDPLGVAATSPRECLIVKIKTNSPTAKWAPLALKLLETEWESLIADMDFSRAARALRVNQNQLLEVVRQLSNYCPYPLQGLRDDERDVMPALPDVCIEIVGTGNSATATITVLEQERTAIHINNHYMNDSADAASVKVHLAGYRREARFLQKAVEQRWKTMERVCLAIFEAQRPYFTEGKYCPTTLLPLTRESIAATLRMHPSTIGRAIEEKNVALPNGRVVPLRFFFDQNVPIRALLRRHITTEEHSMSDSDLCAYLAARGWSMSRRAAAYHREAANILPKKLRSRERLLHQHRSAS